MRVRLKNAIASGNWSNPAIWSGGVKPQPGDHVAANGFTITINENATVDAITKNAIFEYDTVSTPIMSSNTHANGQVIFSDINHFQTNSPPYAAFNGSRTSPNGQMYTNSYNFSVTDVWIGFQYNTPKIIDYIKLVQYTQNNMINDGLFQGFNGTSWVTLHTITNPTGATYSAYTGNTNAYSAYRIKILDVYTASIAACYLYDILFYEKGVDITANQGGQFILNDGVTLTCTSPYPGIYGTDNTISTLLYSGSGTATIYANTIENASTGALYQIVHSGTGTLNLIGTMFHREPFMTNTSADYTYVQYNERYGGIINMTSTGTTNIIGDIYYGYNYGSNANRKIVASGMHTLNITGDIIYNGYNGTNNPAGSSVLSVSSCNQFNHVGDIILENSASSATATYSMVAIVNTNTTITGKIKNKVSDISIDPSKNPLYVSLGSSDTYFITHVGAIECDLEVAALVHANVHNRFSVTGPFVCSTYGRIPISAAKFFVIPTTGNYFVFRNNQNLGNVWPQTPSGTYTLVSPDTIVDSPAEEDVRDGVNYASGTFTGTLKVPLPSQVSKGIQTDNTVGTAALTPEDVWNALTSSMTTPGSIGNRLKNTSTVETTGDQIASLL